MKGDPLSTHYHSMDTRRTRPTRKAQNLKHIQQTASAAPSESGMLLVCLSCSIVHFKVKGCINAFSIRFYLLLRFITFNYVYDHVCRGMSTCCRRPVCEGQERVSNPLELEFQVVRHPVRNRTAASAREVLLTAEPSLHSDVPAFTSKLKASGTAQIYF